MIEVLTLIRETKPHPLAEGVPGEWPLTRSVEAGSHNPPGRYRCDGSAEGHPSQVGHRRQRSRPLEPGQIPAMSGAIRGGDPHLLQSLYAGTGLNR